MNSLTLIGEVVSDPIYFCTEKAQDLTRIQIRTTDDRGQTTLHHCQAWGPLALDLHRRLRKGEWFMVRGPLKYRPLRIGDRRVQLPYIHIAAHSYLGRVTGVRPPTDRPQLRVAAAAS